MKYFLTIGILLFFFTAFCQFTWTGNTNRFTIINTSIQLNDIDANNSTIFSKTTRLNNTEWKLKVKLGFDPSSSNKCIIYLAADTNEVPSIKNAITLTIGENGSSDAWILSKKIGGKTTQLIRGREIYGTQKDSISLKISYNTQNKWQLFTDEKGGENYTLEGEIVDNETFESSYFGLSCIYTKTRATAFQFGNITIHQFEQDVTPPTVSSISRYNTNSLLVNFSEKVRLNSQTIFLNNQNPISFSQLSSSSYVVEFHTIPYNSTLSFSIKNLEDEHGNVNPSFQKELYFEKISPHDIVISEILYDPATNSKTEFIELANISDTPYAIKGLKLARRIEPDSLIQINVFKEAFELQPNKYLAVFNFKNWLGKIPINSYNSTIPSLINEGTTLVLLDSLNNIIDEVTYSPNMHSPNLKITKGISLEKIDLRTHNSTQNWTSASTLIESTPGEENSSSRSLTYSNSLAIDPVFLDLSKTEEPFFLFTYSFEDERSGNCSVYDENGNYIATILNNASLSANGIFKWYVTETNKIVTTGMYIVLWETWNNDGNKKTEKHVVTVVR